MDIAQALAALGKIVKSNMAEADWIDGHADQLLLDIRRSIHEEIRQKSLAMIRAFKAERQLSSLLARIHGDGGHYEDEHGTEQAAADADVKIVKLRAALQEYEDQHQTSDAEATERTIRLLTDLSRPTLYGETEEQ